MDATLNAFPQDEVSILAVPWILRPSHGWLWWGNMPVYFGFLVCH